MSLKNFKMTIKYDGTNFHGWQIQNNARTAQGDIENALKKIFQKQNLNLIGAGRTDSGVHAIGQVANVKIDTSMESEEFKNALNGNLDNDIYISDCLEVDQEFNARFSAIKREYEYKISTYYSPLNRKTYWNIDHSINEDVLSKCANLILGEHDFTQLSKNNPEIINKTCHIYESYWNCNDNSFFYFIKANRFLHHMVRYLVGMMIEISRESHIVIDDLKSMLDGVERKIIFRAPAKGLYLKKIYYE